jgi:hypothetical protein
MRYIYGLFRRNGSELTSPLLEDKNSIQNSIMVRIDPPGDNKENTLDSEWEKLEELQHKLMHLKKLKQRAFNAGLSIGNLSLGGLSVYGTYKIIPFIQHYKSLANQFYQDYYSKVIEDDKNCYQLTNTSISCGQGSYVDYLGELAQKTLSLVADTPQVCNDMISSYCDNSSRETQCIVLIVATLLAATCFVPGGICCFINIFKRNTSEFNVSVRGCLNQDDRDLLIRNGITVNEKTLIDTIIAQIPGKINELKISKIQSLGTFEPGVFRTTLASYLDPEEKENNAAIAYLNTFTKK